MKPKYPFTIASFPGPYEESHLGTRLLSLVLFPDVFFSVCEKLSGNEINLSLHQTVVLGTVGSPLLLEFHNFTA